MWTSYKKKGTWIEGRLLQKIKIDAYVFDKVMIDKWDDKIKKTYPFQEISYRISTGKQSVWLKEEQVDALSEAVKELKQEIIYRRSPGMRAVGIAIEKVRNGNV